MDKNVEISVLFDYYSSMLTDKQRNITDLYYNCDFSLGEIADNLDITRQAVRDTLKRAEHILASAEESLGLASKISRMQSNIIKISALADRAKSESGNTLTVTLNAIAELADALQKD